MLEHTLTALGLIVVCGSGNMQPEVKVMQEVAVLKEQVAGLSEWRNEAREEFRQVNEKVEKVEKEIYGIHSTIHKMQFMYEENQKTLKRIFFLIVAIILESIPSFLDTVYWNISHHFGTK